MAVYGNLMDTINTEMGRRYPDRRVAAGPQRSPALAAASKNVVAPDDEAAKLARFKALRDQIASRGQAGISPVNQALGAAPNPMANRFAGGMSMADAINPSAAQGPSLEDYRQPNSPFRTVGLPMNPWGQDATKAGDKYYSAAPPPARTPPSDVFVSGMNRTPGDASTATPNKLPVGMSTKLFDDHMDRVALPRQALLKELNAAPGEAVVAKSQQKANARRDRLQAQADAQRGISPQQRMQMDIMRGGGEPNPLQMAIMGFPGLADQTVASKGLVDAAGNKRNDEDPFALLAFNAALQLPPGPMRDKAMKDAMAIRGGGAAVMPSQQQSPDDIAKADPTILSDFSKFSDAMKSIGVFNPDEIKANWTRMTFSDPPLGWTGTVNKWGGDFRDALGFGAKNDSEPPAKSVGRRRSFFDIYGGF